MLHSQPQAAALAIRREDPRLHRRRGRGRHAEDALGTIAPGQLADLVVLTRDIMKTPAPEVLTTTVLRTIIAGRTVYQAPNP